VQTPAKQIVKLFHISDITKVKKLTEKIIKKKNLVGNMTELPLK